MSSLSLVPGLGDDYPGILHMDDTSHSVKGNDVPQMSFEHKARNSAVKNLCENTQTRTSSAVEGFNNQAQNLIEEINVKRKQDTQLLAEFKSSLEKQTTTACSELENGLYQVYSVYGDTIQNKLQSLYACLDRISRLETELNQFRSSLGLLYQDVKTD